MNVFNVDLIFNERKKMTENKQENVKAMPIAIHNQYIKDLSLEIPYAPEIFKQVNSQPELKVDVSVESKKIEDSYNVSLKINLNGDIEGKKLFVLELSYAALVTLNVPAEHVEPVIAVEIPRLLFPFARNIITQCLVEGGLPPIMLSPIDFAALYMARKTGN
jgi:preprotein translocase subunit SecB